MALRSLPILPTGFFCFHAVRAAASALQTHRIQSSQNTVLRVNSWRGSSPPGSSSLPEAFGGESVAQSPSLVAGGGIVSRLITREATERHWTCSNGEMTRRVSVLCRAGADKDGNVESDVMAPSAVVKDSVEYLPSGWPTVGLALFVLGFLLGPPLDGIHSRVQLQIYDSGAINLFGLETNIWVPPMLGVFYCLAGLLQLGLDKKFAPKGNAPTASLTKVAASFISVAVLLELSAVMYQAGVPFNLEAYILFFFAELNWVLLENTWWGFGLASFIGVVCPLAEIPIVKLFGLWHYPRGNVSLFGEDFISWVICCYFFYTPFISNLARWLSSYQKGSMKLKQ